PQHTVASCTTNSYSAARGWHPAVLHQQIAFDQAVRGAGEENARTTVGRCGYGRNFGSGGTVNDDALTSKLLDQPRTLNGYVGAASRVYAVFSYDRPFRA